MSTFPFVQVEGTLALPHTGHLASLPVSFGREWKLAPPHFTLRAELRALYAAMLRTMCLSVDAFRAAVRWNQHGAAAGHRPSPVAAHITQGKGAPLSRTDYSQSTPTVSPRHVPAVDRSKLTGGAVAIGGAALLAWIVASHAPHEAETATSQAGSRVAASAETDPSQRLSDVRAQHERAVAGPAQGTATRPSPSAAVSPHIANGESAGAVTSAAPVAVASRVVGTPAPAPAQSSTRSLAPSSVAAGGEVRKAMRESTATRMRPHFNAQAHKKVATPAKLVQREARREGRAVARTAGQRASELRAGRHQDVHKFAPYREARPLTTHRSAATYSEAKRYSPSQPAANPADEYASLLTYVNTHHPARASNQQSVPANSADWVNHVSQRRVTEVPDSFAK
jgi:hypothetical protein